MVPLYKKFLAGAKNWKILVFSGDVDASVPTLGTQRWIECLGQPVVTPFRTWTLDGQVAGILKVIMSESLS